MYTWYQSLGFSWPSTASQSWLSLQMGYPASSIVRDLTPPQLLQYYMTASNAEWSTLIGRHCRDRALICRELYRTEIVS